MSRLATYMPTYFSAEEMAGMYDLFVLLTTKRSTLLEIHNINPAAKLFLGCNIGCVRINLANFDNDPNVQGGWINWTPDQLLYSDMACMANAVRQNLKMGVDWLMRDADGNPIEVMYNFALANVLKTCPKGVWGFTKGKTFLEAHAMCLNTLCNSNGMKDLLSGVAFDMGGNLAVTARGILDHIDEDTWNSQTQGWLPEFLNFLSLLNLGNMHIMINTPGQSHVWPGRTGNVQNEDWAGSYKLESFLTPNGWRKTLNATDFWQSWRYWVREDPRGAFKSGLEYIKSINKQENTVVVVSPESNSTRNEQRRHVRFCVGTFLLSASDVKNVGPYFALDNYMDSSAIPQGLFNTYLNWLNSEILTESYMAVYGDKAIYARKLQQGPFVCYIVVNPNDTEVNGLAPRDATIIQPHWYSFIELMKWRKILR